MKRTHRSKREQKYLTDLKIDEDFYVSDVDNIDDARDAIEILEVSIAMIEGQLEEADANQMDFQWKRKASFALRFKKLAMEQVTRRMKEFEAENEETRRRESMADENHKLLQFISARVPGEQFRQWKAEFRDQQAA